MGITYDPGALQVGEIVLVYGASPRATVWARLLDAAIDWATLSRYHHAAIVSERGTLIEQRWHCEESPLDRYADCASAFRVHVPLAGRQDAARVARSMLGSRYSVRDILADGLRDVGHIPWLPRAHPRRYTCSGMIAECYRRAGYPITYAPIPSPQDLANSPLLIGQRC